jgi:thiamine biosynthesis protein ThiS
LGKPEEGGNKGMNITINGKPEAIPASTAAPTIAQLVVARQLATANLVIELNGKIIRQNDWAAVILADGDRLELLAFVGGG